MSKLIDIEIPRDTCFLMLRRDDGSMTISVSAETFYATAQKILASDNAITRSATDKIETHPAKELH